MPSDVAWATLGLGVVCCLFAPVLILLALQSSHWISPLSAVVWYSITGALVLGVALCTLCCSFCIVPSVIDQLPEPTIARHRLISDEDMALY